MVELHLLLVVDSRQVVLRGLVAQVQVYMLVLAAVRLPVRDWAERLEQPLLGE